jgi:dTDP-4-dehydrorhamnose reductase
MSEIWPGLFAVVYSYNRKELAVQCLASIRTQIVQPERIVFVDNGSLDGTREYLEKEGFLADPRFDFIRLERNTGAAGGLLTGITEAYRRGCAWVWVMDDDVVCQPETLAELKRAFDENFATPAELGFLVSSLIDVHGRANNVPQIDERTERRDRCPEWGHLLSSGLVRVRISTLTSILLPRNTLERCGTPSPDFFLWGEDTDYTLRITEWRPGYLVGPSRCIHMRGVGGFLDICNEQDAARIPRFYYLYRNTMYLRRRFWPARGSALYVAKAATDVFRALAQPSHRLLRTRAIIAGILAGLFFKPSYVPLTGAGPSAQPQIPRRAATSPAPKGA